MTPLLSQTYALVLHQLEEMPRFLQQALAGLPPELMQRRAACDELSLIEHLCHVRDCDPDLYALRIRRILTEPTPLLAPVDVSVWPAERDYRSREAAPVIEDFAHQRGRLIDELRELPHTELARVGRRADGSEINVLGVVGQIAGHDWDHKWRIAAILREFAADGTAAG